MRGMVYLCASFCLLLSVSANAAEYPLPPSLIPLRDNAGRALLAEAPGQRVFLALMSHFVSQETQEFCGVASSVMALNALGVPGPVDHRYEPYRYFTQDTLFSAATEAIIPRGSVTCSGMTLEQMAGILRSYGTTVRAVYARDSSVAAFRADVAAAQAAANSVVLINYFGSDVGLAELEGHWSPLGAYVAKADRVLMLEVARFIYPPFWIDTTKLFKAMNTIDQSGAGRSRGYVIVSYPLTASPH